MRRIVTVLGRKPTQHRYLSGFGDMLRQTVTKNKAVEAPSEVNSNESRSEVPTINSQSELQPEWAALERRVLERKTFKIG